MGISDLIAGFIQQELDEAGGALEVASRSRGTPRIANRLLKRVRDFAQVISNGVITGSNGYLTPTNNATRAQVAAMLHRYLTK